MNRWQEFFTSIHIFGYTRDMSLGLGIEWIAITFCTSVGHALLTLVTLTVSSATSRSNKFI